MGPRNGNSLLNEGRVIAESVLAGQTDVEVPFTPAPGVMWKVRRIAVTGLDGGAVAFYLNAIQPQYLLDGEFNNAGIAAWAPSGDGLYIPQGNTLIAHFYGQAAGQTVTVNLRVTEIKVAE